jgi:CDP-diacylglycerol--serine O-phosphatidyltransferase
MRRGIYVLPSLFTTGGLAMGFWSIIFTMKGEFVAAAWCIVGAGFFDNLDGRVARASRTTTRFGIEYDSLADLISFGLAPALLAYGWALRDFGRFGTVAAFLYVVSAALRLARYNVQLDTQDARVFRGLPTPGSGGMICSTVLFFEAYGHYLPKIQVPFIGSAGMVVLVYLLDYLMVSSIQFTSNKGSRTQRAPLERLALVIAFIGLILWKPEIMLFLIGVFYVSSGPLGIVPRARARRRAGGTWFKEPEEAEEPDAVEDAAADAPDPSGSNATKDDSGPPTAGPPISVVS